MQLLGGKHLRRQQRCCESSDPMGGAAAVEIVRQTKALPRRESSATVGDAFHCLAARHVPIDVCVFRELRHRHALHSSWSRDGLPQDAWASPEELPVRELRSRSRPNRLSIRTK